jgi:hypothetical protein
MEMSQGNSLYYLKQTKMSVFKFYKIKNRRVEQVLFGEVGTRAAGRMWGKGCRRMTIVQILCSYVCKWKNETYSRNGEGRTKDNDEGAELNYIFDIL